MTEESFEPVVYVKQGCPFCFKLRVMLLETGLLDQVEVLEVAPGSEAEQAVRSELVPYLEKVSFPAAQIAPGLYMGDSDAIIAHFAAQAGTDPAGLPTLKAYVEGPFKQLGQLFVENMELKKKLQ